MNVDDFVTRALSSITTDLRDLFAVNPLGALKEMKLTVVAVEELGDTRQGGGACDGVSFLQDGVILYAPSPNSRRENFTLGHELGHALVARDVAAMDWLADQSDTARLLETICDRIASALLLPAAGLTHLDGPVSAQDVLDLFRSTQASRPVCAIAIANRLNGLGAVALVDRYSRQVTFSSVHPHPDMGWPTVFPWRGQVIPPGHPLATLHDGGTMRRRSYWATPWGARQDYYIDACHDGHHLIVVFADLDIWGCETLHLDPPREYLDRPTGEVTCCGHTVQVRGYLCTTCQQHYCPRCQRCRCERSAGTETTCRRCFLSYQPHLIIEGLCEECR